VVEEIENTEQLRAAIHKIKAEGEDKLVKENVRRIKILRTGVLAIMLVSIGIMFALAFFLIFGKVALGYFCFVWAGALSIVVGGFMDAATKDIKEMEADSADE